MPDMAQFGTLYFGDVPQEVGTAYGYPGKHGVELFDEPLRIGNTVEGKELPFIKWRDKYVGATGFCKKVPWNVLNKAGYTYGTPVRINGRHYLCRCIQGGVTPRHPNEWDEILDEIGEDDLLWHWRNQYFWAMDTPEMDSKMRVVRGYDSARNWTRTDRLTENLGIAFRPILEPLSEEPCICDDLVGTQLVVYGPGCPIKGTLVDFSDYDLTLEPTSPLPSEQSSSWVLHADGKEIIDRNKIVCVQKSLY